jgi:hypothetical protein
LILIPEPMKKIITLTLLVFLSAIVFAQNGLKFEKTKENAGMVREGEKLVFEYPFENTGTQPVIISEAKVQCTCTTVEFPKQPVKPGEKGVIKVTFDTTNKMDRQDRTVQLVTNAQTAPYELRFKCVVLKAKKEK